MSVPYRCGGVTVLNLPEFFVGFLKAAASYLRKGYDLIPSWLRGAGLEPAGVLIALTALAIALRLGLETVSTWLAYGQFSTEDIISVSVVAILLWIALGFIMLLISQLTLSLWTQLPKWAGRLLQVLLTSHPLLVRGTDWLLTYCARALVPWTYWPDKIGEILERCDAAPDAARSKIAPPSDAITLLEPLRARLQKLSKLSPPDLKELNDKPADGADGSAWIFETVARLVAKQDERQILQQEIEIGLGKLERALRKCEPDAIRAISTELKEIRNCLFNLSDSAARMAASATVPLVRQRIGLTLLDVVTAESPSPPRGEKQRPSPVAQSVRQDWSGALALLVAAVLWLFILCWGNGAFEHVSWRPEATMVWVTGMCRLAGTLIVAVAPAVVLLWLFRGLYWRVKILRALA